MSTQTIDRVGPALAARIPGKYFSLVTFNRDGTPVGTPMSDLEAAQKLIARKYRLDRVLILPVYKLVQRIRGRRQSGEAAVLAITPADLGWQRDSSPAPRP